MNPLAKEIKNPTYLVTVLGTVILVLSLLCCGGTTADDPVKEKPPAPVIHVTSCNSLKKSKGKSLEEISTYKKCSRCDETEQCNRIVVFVSSCKDLNEEAFAETDTWAKSTITRIYKPQVQSFGVLRVLGEERCRTGDESLCSGWTITGKYCQ